MNMFLVERLQKSLLDFGLSLLSDCTRLFKVVQDCLMSDKIKRLYNRLCGML